jgi:hypothetical protein
MIVVMVFMILGKRWLAGKRQGGNPVIVIVIMREVEP